MSDRFCKIFVGSIPLTITEEEVKSELSKYGTITHFFLMQEEKTSWAIISFQTPEEAKTAILTLDGNFKFPGTDRLIEVRFADKKPDKLDTTQPMATKSPSPWIEYFTPSKHAYYYNTVTGSTQWERPAEMDLATTLNGSALQNRTAAITSATPSTGTTTSFGPRGSNLFIFHIPSEWNDIDLIQHFQHFGNIRSARIQRDSIGRNRGFGFVSFDNIQSARNAIRGMNGFSVGGKYLKVKVKKGEEDANDEGLDTSAMTNLYNKVMPNMINPFPYGNQIPTAPHMHPATMYAPHTTTIRNHLQHYSPY